MTTNEDFREKFYKNYYEQQASRSGSIDVREKSQDDHRNFKKEVLPHLPDDKNARILELGCGYGSLLLFLANHGYTNAIGIDVSTDQAEVANDLGVEVQVADVFSFLQNTAEQFDVIIGFDLIEHFDKPILVELLELINSKLKPDGLVLFRTPNIDAPMGSTYAYGDFTHGVVLNAHSARQLILATGYKQVQVLPSNIQVSNPVKEMVRIWFFFWLKFRLKLQLFATGKSTQGVVFTPNLVIVAKS